MKKIIIVLGCRISEDGTLKPVIYKRIKTAYKVYLKNKRDAIFILSGGQGSDEGATEAEAMASYLRRKKVPKENIYLEEKSTSTYENFKYSKEIILKYNLKGDLVFVTTAPHVLRSGMYARAFGLKATGIKSPARFYALLKMAVREVPAIVAAYFKCKKKDSFL
ncbi:MAG: YdcF family protein [Anaerostipes sp.]|nr:YdcF family protein [Anaerostipes sp.]